MLIPSVGERRHMNTRENGPEAATVDPVGRPIFVFYIGLPASGKTTCAGEIFEDSLKVINCDHIQAGLPGAAAAIASGCPDRLNDLHQIAKPLALAAVAKAIKSGVGQWAYDSTGTGSEVADMATDAIAAGFDVTVLHVSVTVETSLARNQGRFDAGGEDGRLISETIIQAKAEVIEARVAALTRIEGVSVLTVDNNADRPDRAPKTEASA